MRGLFAIRKKTAKGYKSKWIKVFFPDNNTLYIIQI